MNIRTGEEALFRVAKKKARHLVNFLNSCIPSKEQHITVRPLGSDTQRVSGKKKCPHKKSFQVHGELSLSDNSQTRFTL